MRALSLGLAVLLLAGCGAAQPPVDEEQEPPQLFFLEVGGKRIQVELDKPLDTATLGGAKSVTLRVEPYRVFPYGGVKFHYPREYTFEADFSTPGVSLWTLSGSDCKIMIQRYQDQPNHQATLATFKKQLLATYKANKPKESAVKLKLKDAVVDGQRIELALFGSALQQDVYSFQSGKEAVLLVVQDSPKENGSPSADRIRAEKLLSDTLQLPKK